MLHTGDGHGAVFVNAVAAPGQFQMLLIPSSTFMHVYKVRTPLLGHGGGSFHALILSREAAQNTHSCPGVQKMEEFYHSYRK